MKVTDHAVERYRDRLQKEHLTVDQARFELYHLLKLGRRTGRLAWHDPELATFPPPDFFVEVSDGVACPVVNERAVTVLVRAGMGEGARARRNRKRRSRQTARKYARRRKGRERGSRP